MHYSSLCNHMGSHMNIRTNVDKVSLDHPGAVSAPIRPGQRGRLVALGVEVEVVVAVPPNILSIAINASSDTESLY